MRSEHWLKQRRDILGITQDQLAERLTSGGMQITKAAISKWEKGKTPLPLQTAHNRHLIATALELAISELLVLDGYEIDIDFSRETRLIATLCETLSSQDREFILIMVNHLKTRNDPAKASLPKSAARAIS
ncbi:MAG: helix-turn-helix transcriptional regulator [Chitinophagaceae bacterium]|nr:helix-turn-helix transcriptional regulator [Anaerolineae bacterium]